MSNNNTNEIDLKSIQPLILIIGKPHSGKSYLIKDIVFRMKNFIDVIVCFTGSLYHESFDYLDGRFVHSGLNENDLKKMMSVAKTFVERGIKKNFLFIFDDLQLELSKSSDTLLMLINNHRHLGISLIISTQYSSNLSRIGPNLRQNASLYFVFHQPEQIAIDNTFNSCSMGLSKPEFIKMLQKTTSQKYNCLVVDKRNIEKPFSQYIAQSHEKFKFKTK